MGLNPSNLQTPQILLPDNGSMPDNGASADLLERPSDSPTVDPAMLVLGGGPDEGKPESWYDWFWRLVPSLGDSPPDVPTPPSVPVDVPSNGTLTPGKLLRWTGDTVGNAGQEAAGMITQRLPMYAGGVMVDLGTLFVGPEDVALMAALKAGKYVLKPIAKYGKTVLGVFKRGTNLPASPAELADLAEAYKKNLKAAKRLPTMPYAEGLGHHTPAKKIFEGALGYDPDTALAIPKAVMEALQINHAVVTGMQKSLYGAFAKKGKALTWNVIEQIETKALIAGGASPEQALATVRTAIQALKNRGIAPMIIPWGG